MKTILSLFLTAATLFSLGSCNQTKNVFCDDLDCASLSTTALQACGEEIEYAIADHRFLNDYFTIPDYVNDSMIQFAKDSNNLNEIGIFHTTEGNANELAKILKSYLIQSYEKNQGWYTSYIPKEIPKLRDAEIRIYGNYVSYAILSKDQREVFFSAVEKELSNL